MSNKFDRKISLNNKLINLSIFIGWIVIIFAVITGFIMWQKTKDLFRIAFITIGILGVLFNIYLLSRAKDKKQKKK